MENDSPKPENPPADNSMLVTVYTTQRGNILNNEAIHQLALTTWKQSPGWIVTAYVIMPDHIHLLCEPESPNPPSIRRWTKSWKKDMSKSWPHNDAKPIWKLSAKESPSRTPQERARKWAYAQQNPVRRKLVADAEDWPYRNGQEPKSPTTSQQT